MKILNGIKKFFLRASGIDKKSKYIRNYFNDANYRSSIYMSFIVIGLELWMIIRQIVKNIIPYIQENGGNFFSLTIQNTSRYWVLLFAAVGIFLFAYDYLHHKKFHKGFFITNLCSGGVAILYSFYVFKESYSKSNVWGNRLTVILYILLFLFGISIIFSALLKKKMDRNAPIVSIAPVVLFAFICLMFGVRVSNGDFFSGREIIAFLTMVIFVGCILIWNPLTTVVMLTIIFVLFALLLGTITPKGATEAGLSSGDLINYITFYISLTVVAISVYFQRLSEAEKDEELEKLAKEDELTGLYNYQYFIQQASKELQTNDVNKYVYLFMNIENFKSFNDKYGFEKGNEFLKFLSSKIREIFKGDIYGRQGDDHFVALCKIDNFIEKVNALEDIIRNNSYGVFLNLKVGFVKPRIDDDQRHLIDEARYACGTIKNKYDKMICEYDDTMHKGFHRMQYVINNIDNAIKNHWITPFYQPVVWSNNKELCGCEALARWIDPEYGFIYPGEFIPILENCRQIHKLDTAIFEGVCRDLRAAIDNGLEVVPISLNFSRLDFELMDAVQIFDDLINKYNIPKNLVHVEITESALIDNQGILKNATKRFKELGYALWLDDFGSGYSSLNVLKEYEFDVLKIGRASCRERV